MGHRLDAGRVDLAQLVHIPKDIIQLRGELLLLFLAELQPRQVGHIRDFILADLDLLQ
jgi:hypothetical protein